MIRQLMTICAASSSLKLTLFDFPLEEIQTAAKPPALAYAPSSQIGENYAKNLRASCIRPDNPRKLYNACPVKVVFGIDRRRSQKPDIIRLIACELGDL